MLRQEKTGYFLLLSNGRLAFGKARSFSRALCSFSGFIADPFGVWHATQYEMAGNTFLPGDDSCEALIADSSLESSLSLSACDLCDAFRFLVSNFDVLIEEKKKQSPLTFDNFRSHSSRFSQIQFHAFSISWSFTRHNTLKSDDRTLFLNFCDDTTFRFITNKLTIKLGARLAHFKIKQRTKGLGSCFPLFNAAPR